MLPAVLVLQSPQAEDRFTWRILSVRVWRAVPARLLTAGHEGCRTKGFLKANLLPLTLEGVSLQGHLRLHPSSAMLAHTAMTQLGTRVALWARNPRRSPSAPTAALATGIGGHQPQPTPAAPALAPCPALGSRRSEFRHRTMLT